MAYQDISTYTEVDIGANRLAYSGASNEICTFTNLDQDENVYWVKDFGVDNFGDYIVEWEGRYDTGATGILNMVGFGNDADGFGALLERTYVRLYKSGATYYLSLETSGGSGGTYVISVNTLYYFRLQRIGSDITLKTYSDSDRTSLLDTRSATFGTAQRYLYPGGSIDTSTGGLAASGIVQNINLNPATEKSTTDSGSGTSTVVKDVNFTEADSGAGADAISKGESISQADTGAGVEIPSKTVGLTISDENLPSTSVF